MRLQEWMGMAGQNGQGLAWTERMNKLSNNGQILGMDGHAQIGWAWMEWM